jgi:hypothetical protein
MYKENPQEGKSTSDRDVEISFMVEKGSNGERNRALRAIVDNDRVRWAKVKNLS